MDALYATPLPPPAGPLHGLPPRPQPGRAGHAGDARAAGRRRARLREPARLGGARCKAHWGDAPIAGFARRERPSALSRRRARRSASGDYDAFVLTEMVEIRDAISYHDSSDYLRRWARRAPAANPATRVYLYETWHRIDDPEGWLTRLDRDLGRYWEGEILRRAQATRRLDRPIYVIPAGQVLARFVRALRARGGVDGMTGEEICSRATPRAGRTRSTSTTSAPTWSPSPTTRCSTSGARSGCRRALRRADGSAARSPPGRPPPA